MTLDKQQIIDQVKIMAMAYPLKVMANDLDKPYSTLSNELDEREWAKLGFRTVLSMLERSLSHEAPEQSFTAAVKVLDMIEAGFNRVAYNIPKADGYAVEIMRLISDLSVQYAEDIGHLATAMEDGQWTQKEIKTCRKENRDLLTSCLKIEAYLEHLEQWEVSE